MNRAADDIDPTRHCSDDELRRWIRNALDEPSERRVEMHLQSCERCAMRIETIEADPDPVFKMLRRLGALMGTHGASPETIHEASNETHLDSRFTIPSAIASRRRSTMSTEPTTPARGGRWQPERLLASGGIGEVWITLDRQLRRTVALKRLKREYAEIESVRKRFFREARITAQLTHPGTVSIYEVSENEPDPFYVMTLVEGKSLATLIRQLHDRDAPKTLTRPILDLVRHWISVARTIEFAHDQGVLHRDLKSENIMIGDHRQVTVIDWGLAKRVNDAGENDAGKNDAALNDAAHSAAADDEAEKIEADAIHAANLDSRISHNDNASGQTTRVGTRMGTPSFMAPEQAAGQTDAIDQQSDVWGLGAILYEILSGRAPFVGETADETLRQVLDQPLRPLDSIQPQMPDGLIEICHRGLEKSKADRWPSVAVFADAVETWIDSEITRRQASMARQRLFDLSGELMFIADFQSSIVWANAAWQRQLGWLPQQWIGKHSESLVHPEDLVSEIKRQQIRSGETVAHEARIRHVDGTYRWYSWHFTVVPEDQHVYAVGYNIEDRMNRIRDYEALLNAAPDATVVVDGNHVIRFANQQLGDLLGHPPSELTGRALSELIPSRFREGHIASVRNFIDAPFTRPFTLSRSLPARHRMGHEIQVSIRLSVVHFQQATHYVASLRPVE